MPTKWSKHREGAFEYIKYLWRWAGYKHFFCSVNSLKLIKDYCLNLIVRDENFADIVMSDDFLELDKPLMVEIMRKRVYPGRVNDVRVSKLSGESLCFSALVASEENLWSRLQWKRLEWLPKEKSEENVLEILIRITF